MPDVNDLNEFLRQNAPPPPPSALSQAQELSAIRERISRNRVQRKRHVWLGMGFGSLAAMAATLLIWVNGTQELAPKGEGLPVGDPTAEVEAEVASEVTDELPALEVGEEFILLADLSSDV